MFSMTPSGPCVKHSVGEISTEYHSQSRIGSDACELEAHEKQSAAVGDYFLQCPVGCSTAQASTVADANRTLLFRDGYGVSKDGIDTDSKFRNVEQTASKQRQNINLEQRMFSSVPFMGRGRTDPVKEGELWRATQVKDNKGCQSLSETEYKGQYIPLVASLQDSIQNPDYLIEANARGDWVRGGMDTRQFNKEYSASQNPRL